MVARLRRYLRRRTYRTGAKLSRFVARDVRRDVVIVDASEVDAGYVTARIRTSNVLYVAKGLARAADLGEPRRVAIDELWTWTGAEWGGPVPDDSL